MWGIRVTSTGPLFLLDGKPWSVSVVVIPEGPGKFLQPVLRRAAGRSQRDSGGSVTMTSLDLSTQRVSDGSALYADLCREFADAIGWPVRFTPYDDDAVELDDLESDSGLETCWSAEVTDGLETIGKLHVDLPNDPGEDRAFLAVCDLGNLQAKLLSHIATTTRKLARQRRNFSLLLDVGLTHETDNDVRGSLQEYLRAAAELCGFRAAAFFLLTPDGRELRLRVAHGLSRREVPVPHRLMEMMPPDVRAFGDRSLTILGDEQSVYRRWLPDGYATGHCVVVDSHAGPTGSLWLYDRRRREPRATEQRMIRSITSRMADALERIVLLHESAVHHRQNHDLQIASQCQQESGLPLRTQHPAFDSAAVWSSRFELGGDLCDIIPLGDKQAIIAVGDASGDSVPAAMVMSAVRGAIRAVLCDPDRQAIPSPATALQRINQMLNDLTATYQFMSLFLGVLDFDNETLTYCSAGHPPPFVIRDGVLGELNSHGILLGILPDMAYQPETTSFRSGDVLVAYSDGISEGMDGNGELFGAKGIAAALQHAPLDSAASILNAVLEHFERHTSDDSGGDDRTLLVLRAN